VCSAIDRFCESLSPTAWTHILFLGFFQFFNELPDDWVEGCSHQCDWKKNAEEIADKKRKVSSAGKKKK